MMYGALRKYVDSSVDPSRVHWQAVWMPVCASEDLNRVMAMAIM